jgi:adenosylcobinamide-GDP ribazoletransferase
MTVVSHGAADPSEQPDSEAQTPAGFVAWTQAPFFALQFLTIVPPVLVRRPPADADLGRSDAFFPLVGLVLGTTLAVADLVLAPVLSQPVRDVLLVALLAALTGALHLDGVIDTFDGLFAGADRERRLAVMRDPRAGSYGVVAVVLVLALKLAALSSLPPSLRGIGLILAPCLGRWGIVLVTGLFPYARPEGMGRAFKESIRMPHVLVAGAIALVACGLGAGLIGVVLWAAVGLGVMLGASLVTSRLGGLTGDTYGAICELTECLVLLVLGFRIGSVIG